MVSGATQAARVQQRAAELLTVILVVSGGTEDHGRLGDPRPRPFTRNSSPLWKEQAGSALVCPEDVDWLKKKVKKRKEKASDSLKKTPLVFFECLKLILLKVYFFPHSKRSSYRHSWRRRKAARALNVIGEAG